MPVGVLCNVAAVAVGGLLGTSLGKALSAELREKLNLVFGISSMGIGVVSITQMKHMPAVVLALILGTIFGTLIHLNTLFTRGGLAMQRGISRVMSGAAKTAGNESLLVTAIVLFCVSGTGIYGSIVEGMEGDHSILLAKSILDLFTAMIFACNLGPVTSCIALPQAAVFLALFFGAKQLFPLTTPDMVADFKACGGLIMLATGFRIAGIREFPIADMIPAMLLVWPLSALWSMIVF